MNGQPGANPGPGQAPEAAMAVPYRRSQIALGAAFVMLVGAVIAFATHARTVGIILLVLMLLGGMVSFWFSVKFRNQAVAEARAARQAQATASRKKRPTRPGS